MFVCAYTKLDHKHSSEINKTEIEQKEIESFKVSLVCRKCAANIYSGYANLCFQIESLRKMHGINEISLKFCFDQ